MSSGEKEGEGEKETEAVECRCTWREEVQRSELRLVVAADLPSSPDDSSAWGKAVDLFTYRSSCSPQAVTALKHLQTADA
jgi:hypothetical protein